MVLPLGQAQAWYFLQCPFLPFKISYIYFHPHHCSVNFRVRYPACRSIAPSVFYYFLSLPWKPHFISFSPLCYIFNFPLSCLSLIARSLLLIIFFPIFFSLSLSSNSLHERKVYTHFSPYAFCFSFKLLLFGFLLP